MAFRIDVQSETWKAVLNWAREREEQAMATLVSPSCDERLTALKRGEIVVLKQLALLPKIYDQIVQLHARDSHG